MKKPKAENGKGVFYQGKNHELYLQRRNKWIRVAVAGTLLPVFTSFWIAINFDTVGIVELLGNGDVVLSLFALTLTMIADLFEEKREPDDKLGNAFLACFGAILAQILSYITIKSEIVKWRGSTETVRLLFFQNIPQFIITCFQNMIISIAVMISTVIVCIACVAALQNHFEKTTETGGKKP